MKYRYFNIDINMHVPLNSTVYRSYVSSANNYQLHFPLSLARTVILPVRNSYAHFENVATHVRVHGAYKMLASGDLHST